jgi:hypothetical protein
MYPTINGGRAMLTRTFVATICLTAALISPAFSEQVTVHNGIIITGPNAGMRFPDGSIQYKAAEALTQPLTLPWSSTINSSYSAFDIINYGSGNVFSGVNLGGGKASYFENNSTAADPTNPFDTSIPATIFAVNVGSGSAGHFASNLAGASAIYAFKYGDGQAAIFRNSSNTEPTINVFNNVKGGPAAYFEGNVIIANDIEINGNVDILHNVKADDINVDIATARIVQTEILNATQEINAPVKKFHIDHPLDPENKFLDHASVESSDMKNIYDGVALLDDTGNALVALPEWFEALNKDFRYQLTCIGNFAPVYISQKISNNRFMISGGSKGMEVSWQITGIRKDPYAELNRMEVETEKPDGEKGSYLCKDCYTK